MNMNRVWHLTDLVLPRTVKFWDGWAARSWPKRWICWPSLHTILKRVMHRLSIWWNQKLLWTQSGLNSCPIMEALAILAYIELGFMVTNLILPKLPLCLCFTFICIWKCFEFVTLIWLCSTILLLLEGFFWTVENMVWSGG